LNEAVASCIFRFDHFSLDTASPRQSHKVTFYCWI